MSHFKKEDIKAHVLISQYLADQGVKLCGKTRAVATWRGGKGANVAFNDSKGTWRDFKTNEGGDIFSLFAKIEGGDFSTAVKELGKRYGITQSEDDATSSSPRPSRPPQIRLTDAEREEARRRLLPKSARDFVPVTLRNYCRTTAFTGTATPDAFAETVRTGEEAFLAAAGAGVYAKQAARQLRALFRPGDLTWAGWIIKDEAVRARLGYRYAKTPLKPWPSPTFRDFDALALGTRGIFDAYALADAIEAGLVAKIPPAVSLNPVTGKPDANGSFDSAATIAAYRHALVEWDNLFDLAADGMKTPSQAHIETAAGLADYSFEHPDKLRVVSATYSGGKSIHVALRVKADKLLATHLRDLFASADDETFRADPAGWDNGYTHIRLAGAIRPETGRRARLLWTPPA